MIDIVQTLRDQHPDLGPYVLALRSGSPVLTREADDFTTEVRAWMEANAPSGVLAQRTVEIASRPGEAPVPRQIAVAVFGSSVELAAFATTWT